MGQRAAHRKIVPLRREMARLLGYRDFAEVSWCRRWPSRRARCSRSSRISPGAPGPLPSRTWPSCGNSAREELGLDKLESWDVAYASEKLRAKRYSFSDQEVKQYFPRTRPSAACSPSRSACMA
jgi:oligopeptidase A